MWQTVEELKTDGVTIILTTHYIEEAEAIADRIAVINRGAILLVEDKAALMARMGRKELRVELGAPLGAVPDALSGHDLRLEDDGGTLVYAYDTAAARTGIGRLMADLTGAGLHVRDVSTAQDSLEDIFVGLVTDQAGEGAA
jgi:ABC-2 type transport system ATP-binding protein